eukprot:GFYU01022030.1.p1 GENE.GFYU01022030.1~~GFYU01022030.1.p1  ORF type:complete len:268 (-),score=62.34 GFYU01022030.1:105-887(-)
MHYATYRYRVSQLTAAALCLLIAHSVIMTTTSTPVPSMFFHGVGLMIFRVAVLANVPIVIQDKTLWGLGYGLIPSFMNLGSVLTLTMIAVIYDGTENTTEGADRWVPAQAFLTVMAGVLLLLVFVTKLKDKAVDGLLDYKGPKRSSPSVLEGLKGDINELVNIAEALYLDDGLGKDKLSSVSDPESSQILTREGTGEFSQELKEFRAVARKVRDELREEGIHNFRGLDAAAEEVQLFDQFVTDRIPPDQWAENIKVHYIQ